MAIITKITINFGGKEIELTLDEANALKLELNKLLQQPTYPWYIPCPVYPVYPPYKVSDDLYQPNIIWTEAQNTNTTSRFQGNV